MQKVILETSASRRPGRDRGMGRYLDAVIDANARLGNVVERVDMPMGSGRLAEWLALPGRELKLLRHRGRDAVFHAPSPYYCLMSPGQRQVVSILDLIPLDLDAHRQTGFKAEFFHRRASRADVVLTLSEHAASRITDRLGVDAGRIVIAPLPPGPEFTPAGSRFPRLPDRYVAAMADYRTPDPRKRLHWIESLADAMEGKGIPVVVVGPGTSERFSGSSTVGLGRLPDHDLASVLRGAELFAYSSAYEGQGMPPLEAISCGTPVVAMQNSALPEVVGRAGVLVPEAAEDPASRERFVDSCIELFDDPHRLGVLRDQCATQASRFSAERFAQSVMRAYELAAA